MLIRSQNRMAFIDPEKGIGFECYQGGIYCLGINDSDGRPALQMGFYESEEAAQMIIEELYDKMLHSENYNIPRQKDFMKLFGYDDNIKKNHSVKNASSREERIFDQEDLTELNKILTKECGVAISKHGSHSTDKIGGQKKLLWIYNDAGRNADIIVRLIKLLIKAWPKDKNRFDMRILLDVYAFMKENNWNIDDDEVAKKISKIYGKNGRHLTANEFALRVDRENLGAVTKELYYRYRTKK